jgi:integrase
MQAAAAVIGGVNPVEAAKAAKVKAVQTAKTVGHVLDEWFAKHVEKEGLRSAPAIRGYIDKHLRPVLGAISVYDLKRSQIVACLDDIPSSRVADLTYATLSAALTWCQKRDDEFRTPIVRGMRKTPKPRERILSDEELRDLWTALAELERAKPDHIAPAFVRTLLLSACRRDEVGYMHAREIADGRWIIPANRYKTKREHLVNSSKPGRPVRLNR